MEQKKSHKYVFLIEALANNGGQEIQTINLVNALNENGVDAIILSLWTYKGDCRYVLSLSEEEYVDLKKNRNSLINKLSFDKKIDSYIRKILLIKLREIGCEVLVNQTYEFAHMLPFCGDIKVLQVLHWSIGGYEESLIKTSPYKGLAKALLYMKLKFRSALRLKGLGKSDGIVTLTQSAIAEVRELLPNYDERNIHVVYNSLPYSEDSSQYSKLENKKVCFVGRLSVEKGCMRLLRIWEKVSVQLPEHTLLVYGDGPCRSNMEEYINSRKLNRIKLCGFERDLKKIYSNADLLFSTSDSEGFGLIFIEAFYYGVPVVSFDCPVSPREVIANAGILVHCFDEYAYADAVVALLQDAERMKELQNKAIDRAKYFYSNRITSEWEKLLVSI